MRIKLYSCHHNRPLFPATGDVFVPIWTGGEADPAGRWITDLQGLNLHAAPDFNEMRQQFFVWRNLMDGADYIGFEHYRRLFLLDPLPADDCGLRFPRVLQARRSMAADTLLWRHDSDCATFIQYLQLRRSLTPSETETLTRWVASYDIIAPRRHTFAPMEIQWKQCKCSDEVWDAFVKSISLSSFWRDRKSYINFAQVGTHYCNMFIMKIALFDEYMQFWSEVMFNLQGAVDRSLRYLGYLSERLFSLWVLQKQIENSLLRVVDVPYLFCPDEALGDEMAAAGLVPA
jgi:hypothetical protein